MLRELGDLNKVKTQDKETVSDSRLPEFLRTAQMASRNMEKAAEMAEVDDDLELVQPKDIFDKDAPEQDEASVSEHTSRANPATAQGAPINPDTFIPPFGQQSMHPNTETDEVTADPADDMAEVAEDLAPSHANDNSAKVSSTQEAATVTKVVAAAPSVAQAITKANGSQTPASMGIADPIDEDELEEIQLLTYGASCMKDLTSSALTPPRYIVKGVLTTGLTGLIMPKELKAKSFLFELARAVETGTPLVGQHAIQKTGEMFYLLDLERNAELTMMQEENLLPMCVKGLRYQVLEKENVHLKSRNFFKEAAETIHTKTVIMTDGVLQSYLEKTFTKQPEAVILAGAKTYLEALKKFAHAQDVAVIVPLYLHRNLEKKIVKAVMGSSNPELADTILTMKGNADKGEYRIDVSRRGVHRMTLNVLWTQNGWTMKPTSRKGSK